MIILFLKALLVGVAIAAPIGPVGLLCIHRSLHQGFKAGLATGLGAATADGIYGLIAILGLSVIANLLVQHQFVIRLIGGILLIIIGVRMVIVGYHGEVNIHPPKKSDIRAYVSAFFLTLTNPIPIFSIIVIFAALGLNNIPHTYEQSLLLIIGIILGSTIWWVFLSGFITLIWHRRVSFHILQQINRITGVIIVIFGIIALIPLSAIAGNIEQHFRVLRIGITADYPPYTETITNANGTRYRGFDIDMAQSLGRYLKVKIQFVKTTWPTLTSDLLAGKFDLAMGGISDTAERRKVALISVPILSDGKVPLVRCADLKKYPNLKSIDQPNVRVVENRGGTNIKFATEMLKKSQIIAVATNEETLTYLLNNQADVMITDRVEALYRQTKYPKLCVVTPQKIFQQKNKIYLINKENFALQKKVNEWLYKIKNTNELQQYKKNWGIP